VTALNGFWGLLAVLACWAMPVFAGDSSPAPAEGVAVAIVLDTSGSMAQTVLNRQKKPEAKCVIANRALLSVVKRLEAFSTNQTTGKSLSLETCLIVFVDGKSSTVIPLGPFSPEPFQAWLRQNSRPNGGTPLGESLRSAADALFASKAQRRHVIVLTDGENTVGADPVTILPRVQKEAELKNAFVGVHFVAFDVAARVFDQLKAKGATVLAAADESQLQNQLAFILEKKVLLEE
jgi:hypothetical protein